MSLLPQPRKQKPSRAKRASAPPKTLYSQTKVATQTSQNDSNTQQPNKTEDFLDFMFADTDTGTGNGNGNDTGKANTTNPFMASSKAGGGGLGGINENTVMQTQDNFDPFEDMFGDANNNGDKPPQSNMKIHPKLLKARESKSLVPDALFDVNMWTNFDDVNDNGGNNNVGAFGNTNTNANTNIAPAKKNIPVRAKSALISIDKNALQMKKPNSAASRTPVKKSTTKAKAKAKTKAKPKNSTKGTKKSKQNSNAAKKLPALGHATQTETNCLVELHRGSALLKYPRRSGFPHFKHIQLSKDNLRVQWFSKRKPLNQTCILIKEIRDVVQGQDTEVFKKFHQQTLEKSSFSIVYGHKYNTLDVAAKSIDECEMWVRTIRKLVELYKNKEVDVSKLKVLKCGIHFKDRNRPMSRQGSGNFVRANNSKTLKIEPDALKEIERDMAQMHKTYAKVAAMTQKAPIMNSEEYPNIQSVLSELEERIEELTYEIANIRDTDLAKREVWRANVDLTAMQEKVEVLQKHSSSGRRQSNFI